MGSQGETGKGAVLGQGPESYRRSGGDPGQGERFQEEGGEGSERDGETERERAARVCVVCVPPAAARPSPLLGCSRRWGGEGVRGGRATWGRARRELGDLAQRATRVHRRDFSVERVHLLDVPRHKPVRERVVRRRVVRFQHGRADLGQRVPEALRLLVQIEFTPAFRFERGTLARAKAPQQRVLLGAPAAYWDRLTPSARWRTSQPSPGRTVRSR